MKLSQIITEYRNEHHLSQRQFAQNCGLSNTLISLIEGEKNPTTGKQLAPSLKTLQAIANGMGLTVNQLLTKADDIAVDIGDSFVGVAGTVPVVDGIAAGLPVLAEENIIDYMPVTVRNPEEYFALVVRGNSMINAGIPNGCKVLVRMQNTAENGQIVACRLNGDEATLKRFKQVGDTVLLMPENPQFEPIIVPIQDFDAGYAEIIGVVRQIIIDVT